MTATATGSGKSTLMHVLAGLDDVDGGVVLLGDTDLSTLSERHRTLLRRERIGSVFQSFNLVPPLTAAAEGRCSTGWADPFCGTLSPRSGAPRCCRTPPRTSRRTGATGSRRCLCA